MVETSRDIMRQSECLPHRYSGKSVEHESWKKEVLQDNVKHHLQRVLFVKHSLCKHEAVSSNLQNVSESSQCLVWI